MVTIVSTITLASQSALQRNTGLGGRWNLATKEQGRRTLCVCVCVCENGVGGRQADRQEGKHTHSSSRKAHPNCGSSMLSTYIQQVFRDC